MAKNLTLENSYVRVVVNTLGAELTSFFDKRDSVEHMWSADPKFWPRRAPILFPCVGESKGGKITVSGVDYPMGRHGFTRMQDFKVVEHSSEMVELELTDSTETMKHYPFKFRLKLRYTLTDSRLEQRLIVENLDADSIGFQLGGHPAFAVPFGEGQQYSDYCVRFDQKLTVDRHLLNDEGLYTGETRPVLKDSDQLDLTYDLFDEDALVFKQIPSKRVWISRKDRGKRLEVKYDDFLHLGIWSVPGANYVCIEPWIGCADDAGQEEDFLTKDSLVNLKPSGQFTASFTMELVQ